MSLAKHVVVPAVLAAFACSGGQNGAGNQSGSRDSGSLPDGAAGGDGSPAQESLQPLPSVRQEHAVVALEGEIYVIGGFAPGVSASVAAYDPSVNRWRDVAGFPMPFHHANAAAVGGTLYVAGFYAGSSFSNADGRTFAYDPQQDRWAERRAMPLGTERASACVAVVGSKIYVFGGANGTTVRDASAYDTDLDDWQSLPPLPEPREHCVAEGIDGIVYIASGRSDGIAGFEATTWAYDPAAQRYDERAPIRTPRGGTAGAVLAGKLFVFGGEGNASEASGVFPNVEAYDPRTDGWEAVAEMLVPRHGFGGAALADRIYLPGGATQQAFGAVDSHTVFFFE